MTFQLRCTLLGHRYGSTDRCVRCGKRNPSRDATRPSIADAQDDSLVESFIRSGSPDQVDEKPDFHGGGGAFSGAGANGSWESEEPTRSHADTTSHEDTRSYGGYDSGSSSSYGGSDSSSDSGSSSSGGD